MPRRAVRKDKDVLAAKASEDADKQMKLDKVRHIIDKNAKTMVKILQLQEVSSCSSANSVDKDQVINRRIEILKARMNRRLVKLSKWVDLPERSREPPPPPPPWALAPRQAARYRPSHNRKSVNNIYAAGYIPSKPDGQHGESRHGSGHANYNMIEIGKLPGITQVVLPPVPSRNSHSDELQNIINMQRQAMEVARGSVPSASRAPAIPPVPVEVTGEGSEVPIELPPAFPRHE